MTPIPSGKSLIMSTSEESVGLFTCNQETRRRLGTSPLDQNAPSCSIAADGSLFP
jgi:hypothetical protein